MEKGGVERKTTLMIWEFKRYKVFAASISETKWFRNGIYEVEDYTILHSGRNMPGEGEPAHRGEGMGLVLNPAATQAWRQGGEVWEPVSPRMVAAKLKVKKQEEMPTSASGECVYMHQLSELAMRKKRSSQTYRES